MEESRGCLCKDEFMLGSECQIEGELLVFNKQQKFLILPEEWKFFYFAHDYEVKINLQKQLKGELRIYLSAYDKG